MPDINTNAANEAENNVIDSNINETTVNEGTPNVEELMAQIAALNATIEKQKTSISKANSEAADFKKQLRAKMSQDELNKVAEDEAKARQQAELDELKAFKAFTVATERYQVQGMSVEMAKKAAQAEIDGDMDALRDIQKKYSDSLLKAKEAEWLANRPAINSGVETAPTMTMEQIMAIKDPLERQEAIKRNSALFKNY